MPASKKVSDRNPIGQVFNKLLENIGESEEFSLPDWLNEGKPTPYTYIKRIMKIYTCRRKQKKRLRTMEYSVLVPCPMALLQLCVGVIVIVGMHQLLNASCSSDCYCGNECNNKPFQQRRVKKLKIIQTKKCGSGIVADEYIQEGEFITEYVGEVIDDATCAQRLWEMKGRGETNFYLCEINRNMVIDATKKGNKSRYINHSCNPNTQMQTWIIEGETRIGIFAISDINKGEHITYDYHRFVPFGEDQDCHCGAIGCRKKLGVKPNKPKLVPDEETRNIVVSELAQQTLPPVF
uniref:SET domain-containing protein n=1 Tax=Brassica oleracea var. oleracea TaxID=109376 RepID=A0A0D3B6N9_BRAOL